MSGPGSPLRPAWPSRAALAIAATSIMPVVNESDNLRQLLPRLKAVMQREGLSFEIVVVDGGSSDGTPQTAAEMGVRSVGERRRGYAGALETGFAEARGDYVLTLDA